jgi:Tol biopolymer transport system component
VNLGPLVNSSSAEFFPSISKDGLSLYFTAQSCPATTACRPGFGGWDIYVSQRVGVDEPWSVPQNAGPSVNSAFDEVGPGVSPDGHRLFFASNRPGGFGGNDIYVAWRTDKHDDFAWEPADNLGPGVNSAANDAAPSLLSNDDGIEMLYFDSNQPGGPGPFTEDVVHNGNDIYVSPRLADGTFGPAALVTELSTPYADRRPAVRRDGLEMIFSSNRPDGRIGVLDLWVTTRDSITAAWSAPVNLGPVINGVNQQAGAALSFDGRTLYFQASGLSRPGFGAYDLFAATRDKLNGGRNR